MTIEKSKLLESIKDIRCLIEPIGFEETNKKLEDLEKDIEEDVYNIVVMGEFKRGKSTFINALLGRELLPTDILPETTTINALRYGENIDFTIYRRDGVVLRESGNIDILKSFSAQNRDFDPEVINYVEIGYPLDYLQQGLMIIDTPGVSDINQQRCEITYGFVPKSNAVLFLLDATSPLKKTEVDFIQDKLINIGVDNIIFVLNKFDLIDEEEEDDIVESTIDRIRKNFTENNQFMLKDIKVLPVSAKDALEGTLKGDMQLYKLSGMENLKEALSELFDKGRIEEEKKQSYKRRLENVITDYMDFLQEEKVIQHADVEELRKASSALSAMVDEKVKNRERIIDYVDSNKLKILTYACKSLDYFKQELQEDIEYEINQYKSTDFKSFIENRLHRIVLKRTEQWFLSNNPKIDSMIANLQKELEATLSRGFSKKINLRSTQGISLERIRFGLNLQGEDHTMEVTLTSGLTMASGALIAMTAFSSIMPVLSVLAFPTIKSYMMKNKIEEAKKKCVPLIFDKIEEIIHMMKKTIEQYVFEKSDAIKVTVENAYDEALKNYKERIEEQLKDSVQEKEQKDSLVENIDNNLLKLESFLTQLQ